jgi:nitronate monooxygenase
MQAWPDCRLLDLLNIEIPIIQAPMARLGFCCISAEPVLHGALGSLACALLTPDEVRERQVPVMGNCSDVAGTCIRNNVT